MKKLLIVPTVLLLLQLNFAHSALADVVQLDREEVIQESSFIFVGKVLKKECRWNKQGNLIVTDYEFQLDETLFGTHDEVTLDLRFAGGTIGNETHAISDVPEFQTGDSVLLMLESKTKPLMSPVTGMYQGKFVGRKIDGQKGLFLHDAHDKAVTDAEGKYVSFSSFVAQIKTEIPIAKSKAPRDRRVPLELQHLVIQNLPAKRYDPNAVIRRSAETMAPASRQSSPAPNDPRITVTKPTTGSGDDSDDGYGPQNWSYSNRVQNPPIVFNPWPTDWAEWLRYHDQYAMSYWNDYCDIYQVTAPTGTWAWQNDVFDMTGFPSDATMNAQFGQGWGSNTLAVCWRRWINGWTVEADISCNPAFSWTTDDYDTYSNSNLYNLDRTLTHEVGHSWGLDHQFNALSVMNYAPHKYRAYNDLYMDDVLAVRAAFPAEAVSQTDLGCALFYANGSQNYDDSDLSTTNVASGDAMTVSNFIIENSGTNAIAPEIEWYLCPTINSWTGAVYVGTTTHSTLDPGFYFNTSRTLTIPSGVPNGTYYLGAFVANSTDNVSDNNHSWLDREIDVFTPEPPPNDDWANTIFLPTTFTTPFSGDNYDATEEAGEQHLGPAYATVWWYTQAPSNCRLRINTFGSNFDTMLHVYTGFPDPIDQLQLVASNDDYGGLQSRVTFTATSGTFYEIRVAGYNGASGDINGQLILLGDANADNVFDFADIEPFVLALFDATAYQSQYPAVDRVLVLDMNGDGSLDFGDIEPFVDALFGN